MVVARGENEARVVEADGVERTVVEHAELTRPNGAALEVRRVGARRMIRDHIVSEVEPVALEHGVCGREHADGRDGVLVVAVPSESEALAAVPDAERGVLHRNVQRRVEVSFPVAASQGVGLALEFEKSAVRHVDVKPSAPRVLHQPVVAETRVDQCPARDVDCARTAVVDVHRELLVAHDGALRYRQDGRQVRLSE